MAVGFANGAVTLIRGDLKNDRGAKQRTIYESEEPITGVEFREGSKLTTLYVSTTSRILTLVISGKGQGQQPRTLENSGCAVGCMKLDRRTGNIVVAREDAIYNYGLNGRGRTVAFNCPKSQAVLFNDYLAIVSPPRTLTSASKQSVGSNSGGESYRSTTLTIIDPDLRYIAFSEPLLGSVKTVFYQWGDLFVLATDGKVRVGN